MSLLEVAVVVSLRSAGRYMTGDELGQMCGATPGRIKATVRELVERGYRIDEVPGEGFRLTGIAPTLDGEDIRGSLSTKTVGSEVYAFGRVGSTNDVATSLAKAGAPDGCLVIAEEQTRGRGRLGRRWHSPPSAGLWFSLILKPDLSAEAATTLSLAAALGVATAFDDRYGIPARIKWPNDVLVHGRKICGILTEAEFLGSALNFVVVGIGINVLGRERDFPEELRAIATSVEMEAGDGIARGEVLSSVLEAIESKYLRLKTEGFSGLKSELLGRSSLIGRVIRVHTGEGLVEGTAVDIDDRGALMVRHDDGSLRRILAGDVVGVD
jgi:BirA family biotin operon repressor/biotin-[acetyl-CoA-carboxylase] ligase